MTEYFAIRFLSREDDPGLSHLLQNMLQRRSISSTGSGRTAGSVSFLMSVRGELIEPRLTFFHLWLYQCEVVLVVMRIL